MHTNLSQVREQLLSLHKALLEYQKHIYESTVGPMQNPNHYYNLVINDPSFAWLRTLSALVISIDEILEGKDEITDAKVGQIVKYTKGLLTATEGPTPFEKSYVEAIQRDAQIALLHGKLMQLLTE